MGGLGQGDGGGGRGMRVLIVDDSRDTARMMRLLLSGEGYEARVAFDGLEAVEVAREFRPAVVLLDLGLPGMSGAEVASELRGTAGFEATVIVAISGYGADRVPSGFDGHFVKPVDHDALLGYLARKAGGE